MATSIKKQHNKLTIMNGEWWYKPRWTCRFAKVPHPSEILKLTKGDYKNRLDIPDKYDQIAVYVRGGASFDSVKINLRASGYFKSNHKWYESERRLYDRSKISSASVTLVDIVFQIKEDNWYTYTKENN